MAHQINSDGAEEAEPDEVPVVRCTDYTPRPASAEPPAGVAGKGAGEHSDAAPCPDCHGSGRIVLFTSSGPCGRCGGSGTVGVAGQAVARPECGGDDDAPNGAAGTGYVDDRGEAAALTTRYTYDAQGRLSTATTFRTASPVG